MTIRDDDTLVKQSAQQEPHMAVTVDHKQAFVEGLKPTQRQEPVGEVFINTGMGILFAPMKDVRWKDGKMPPEGTKLYTSPPIEATPLASQSRNDVKPWVGLTDEEREIASWKDGSFGAGARWAEAKLRERNEHREKNA